MAAKPRYARHPRLPPNNPLFDTSKLLELVDTQQGFSVRGDDVFIATYPRSGTTLTQQLVHLLLKHSSPLAHPFTTGATHRHTAPWLEALYAARAPLPEREAPATSLALLERFSGPRIFKTHSLPRLLPGACDAATPTPRVVVVVRNPKDTAVSLYHHIRGTYVENEPNAPQALRRYACFCGRDYCGASLLRRLCGCSGAASCLESASPSSFPLSQTSRTLRRVRNMTGPPSSTTSSLAT